MTTSHHAGPAGSDPSGKIVKSPLSTTAYNSRLGLSLFFVYLALYMGFVLTNAFAAESMDVIVFAGLNLAIIYGFGLILAAILLSLVYGIFCRNDVGPHVRLGDTNALVDTSRADETGASR